MGSMTTATGSLMRGPVARLVSSGRGSAAAKESFAVKEPLANLPVKGARALVKRSAVMALMMTAMERSMRRASAPK